MRNPCFCRSSRAGFSLVELLVVIGVIGIMAVMVVPAFNSVLRGTQLAQSVQTLESFLITARQHAIANNRDVEVRFYRYADSSLPGENVNSPATWRFRGMQAYEYADDGSATAIGKVVTLPKTIVMDSSATISPLLSASRDKDWGTDLKTSLPGIGTNYDVRVFRFRPDGSTDLTSLTQWFVTLHSILDGDNLSQLPDNFATVQVDAVNGRARTYRR